MKSVTIRLNTINDVKQFVNTVCKCDYDVDLISGRYAVDAKSIMGIFSLDLTHPLDLCAYTDGDEKLQEDLKPYLVDEGA